MAPRDFLKLFYEILRNTCWVYGNPLNKVTKKDAFSIGYIFEDRLAESPLRFITYYWR